MSHPPAILESLEPRRLLAAGEVDLTFGRDGVASAAPDPAGNTLVKLLPTPDGKLLAFATDSQSHLEMVRFTHDGQLDMTFGNGGSGAVRTDFSPRFGAFTPPSLYAIDPSSGRIAVIIDGPEEAVAVFNADGSSDLSVNGTGRIAQPDDLSFTCDFIAFQADGKLLVLGVGPADEQTGVARTSVRRFRADGTRDMTFGNDGETVVSGVDSPRGILVTPDGRFAVVGDYTHFDVLQHFLLGSNVTMFSRDGELQWQTTLLDFTGESDAPTNPEIFDVAVAPDSSLWVVATAQLIYLNHVGSDGELLQRNSYEETDDAVPGALDVDEDGSVLYVTTAGSGEAGISRLFNDATFDPTWHDGVAPLPVGTGQTLASLTHQGDRAIVGGMDLHLTRLQGGAGTQASITFDRRRGSLIVTGDGGPNVIYVYRRPHDGRIVARIHLDARAEPGEGGEGDLVRSFAPSRVKRIGVFGGFGPDEIFIDASLGRGCYVDGGDGGDGGDEIHGGDGNDLLVGNFGDDFITGDDGEDTLLGGGGNDSLFGNAGADLLYGNDGHDTLRGNGGNDRLVGGARSDLVPGDFLSGGDGIDRGLRDTVAGDVLDDSIEFVTIVPPDIG